MDTNIFECMLIFIGYITLLVLIFFATVHLLGKALSFKPSNDSIEMPSLIPIPIDTKSQPRLHKVVVFVTQPRRWELAEDWSYKLDEDTTLVIEKGFEFDGASIPRIFWAILSPTGLLLIPGLIHDYGYRYDQIWKREKDGDTSEYSQGAGKLYWDKLFKKVGNDVNEVGLINFIATLAVILGGKSTWHKHRSAGKAPNKPQKINIIQDSSDG